MSEPSGRHPQDYLFQPDDRFQVEQWSANVDDTEVSYAADHVNAKDNDLLMTTTADGAPLVAYLVLGEPPYLRARACISCGARYFDRRNACASCFATEF